MYLQTAKINEQVPHVLFSFGFFYNKYCWRSVFYKQYLNNEHTVNYPASVAVKSLYILTLLPLSEERKAYLK
jgi:hypothetical protein